MWTTFQRLPIGKIRCIGIVKVDFFDKNQFYRFVPPSWILNIQTQCLLKTLVGQIRCF
jgi:hypothetical protein